MKLDEFKIANTIALVIESEDRIHLATEQGDNLTVSTEEFKEIASLTDKVFVYGDAVRDKTFLQKVNAEPIGKTFDVKLADSMLTAGLNLNDGYSDITQRYLGETKLTETPQDLLSLWEKLRVDLYQQQMINTAMAEFGATSATAKMQNNGLRLDVGLLKEKQQALFQVKENTAGDISQWLSEKLPHETEAIAAVDWASNAKQHKSEILRLFKAAGVPLESSLSKQTLNGLSSQHPILEKLVEHRSAHHRIGKGGIGGLLDRANEQGMVYPTWRQNEAATGRMSARDPAAQNIPYDLAEAVIPSKDGYVFVRADYSQIELRILAEMAGDTKLIEAFKEGKDPHRLTASLMTGEPESEITDAERKAAKPVNFGKVYGQSAQGLVQYARSAYGVHFTLEEAEQYQKAITIGYPQVGERERKIKAEFTQQWQQSQPSGSETPLWENPNTPHTRTISGRKRHWQPITGQDAPVTEALNAPIQGTSADITKTALGEIYDLLPRLKADLVAARHDEIVLQAPIEEAERVGQVLNQIMVKAGETYLKEVPVVCDVEICDNLAGQQLTPEQYKEREERLKTNQMPVTVENKPKNKIKTPQKTVKQLNQGDFDIRAYVNLSDSGNEWYRADCPCCAKEGKELNNQNLSISKETGYVKCWRDTDNHNLPNIREALGLPRSGPIPEQLRRSFAGTVSSPPKEPVVKIKTKDHLERSQQRLLNNPTALAYLESRGITPDMAQRYNLGLESDFKLKNGMERPESMAIFYQDATDSDKYYLKRRYAPWESPENLPSGTPKWGQYGVPATVWVTHNPPDAKETYLCEGAWDAIRLSEEIRQSGEKIAVACCTTGATGIPPKEQLAAIPTDNVTIFYDLDKAGKEGASKMVEGLSEVGKKGTIATVPHQERVKDGYDVSDALDAGVTLPDFHKAASTQVTKSTDNPKPPLQTADRKKTTALVSVKRIRSEATATFDPKRVDEQARSLLEFGALVKPIIVRRDGPMNFLVHPDSAFDLAVAQRARVLDPKAGEMVNAWILETPVEEKAYQTQVSQPSDKAVAQSQKPSVIDLNQGKDTPHQQQAQRTVEVAKIVTDLLCYHETSQHSGKQYTANWDRTSKTLSLVSNTKNEVLMMAQYHQGSWHPLPVPLSDRHSPNLTDADLSHFRQLAPKIQDKLKKKEVKYRQWYENNKAAVLENNPQLSQPHQIDLAIATELLKITDDPNDVGRILNHSDLAQQWRSTLPEKEANAKILQYASDIHEQANRSLIRKNPKQEPSKKQDLELH